MILYRMKGPYGWRLLFSLAKVLDGVISLVTFLQCGSSFTLEVARRQALSRMRKDTK